MFQYVAVALCAYLIFSSVPAVIRNSKNNKVVGLMNLVKDKDSIFDACDAYFNEMSDPEFVARGHVIKLWALAYHDMFDAIKEELDNLNLYDLIQNQGRRNHIELNEDSFFFMYIVIPNRLAAMGRLDLCEEVYNKMDTVAEIMDSYLVYAIGEANRQCYRKSADRGKEFYDKVMEGDYAEYSYTKQLIGTYKSVVQAMRAKLFADAGEMDKLEEIKEDLKYFDQMSLGHRYLEELDLTKYLEEETEESTEEE